MERPMTDKSTPVYLFPGSNTCTGFAGFFDDLRKAAQWTVLLKGGPGVGKSTLMRETARRLEEKGCAVTYYHCSGDPESLDAVFARDIGFLVMDATAPHTQDPALPGAADCILNLGICLKEKTLREQRGEIATLQKEIAAGYARATRFLAAAERFRADAEAVCMAAFPAKERREMEDTLFAALPDEPEGELNRVFSQAITCQGVVQCPDAMARGAVLSLDVPWGFDAHALFTPLLNEALRRHAATTVYADPLDARRIAHLAVGDTLFTTAVFKDARVLAPALDEKHIARESGTLAFDKAVYELTLHQAVEALADAKQYHDRLERVYADAMDYAVLRAVKQEFLEGLPV